MSDGKAVLVMLVTTAGTCCELWLLYLLLVWPAWEEGTLRYWLVMTNGLACVGRLVRHRTRKEMDEWSGRPLR